MSEDAKHNAVRMVQRAGREFKKTGNQFWAIVAAAECFRVGWDAPPWAEPILRQAVVRAWDMCETQDLPPSLSDPKSSGRGKDPDYKQVIRNLSEGSTIDLAVIVYRMFDVSIDEACRIVIDSIDVSTARHIQEERRGSEIRLPGEDGEFLRLARLDFERFLAKLPVAAQAKARAGKELLITRGDMLGITSDTLADRLKRKHLHKEMRLGDTEYSESLWTEFTGQRLTVELMCRVDGFDEVGEPQGKRALDGYLWRTKPWSI